MKLAVGFIIYNENTAKYLPYFLPSLYNQNYNDFFVFAVDNSVEKNNGNFDYLKNNYPKISIYQAGKNLGYGKAFNLMIRQAIERGCKYFLVLNGDTILEPEAIERLVSAMDGDGRLGSAGPQILKWDFKNNKKTDIIDTCGIGLLSGLRFVDLAQGEERKKENPPRIIGPSGAAAIYRLEALEKIKFDNQYFDELMFMYKEDCDLAYRLFLAGYQSKCVCDSIIYHDRTVFGTGEGNFNIIKGRRNKSKQAKKWSFLNQQIIYYKFWRLQNFREKINIIQMELKMLAYALLFEQYLLLEFWNFLKIRKEIDDR